MKNTLIRVPCIPGVHKLFVDVLGNYYPCEKVCEESKDMIIGNVESGFDKSQVDKLLNIGKMTEVQCKIVGVQNIVLYVQFI